MKIAVSSQGKDLESLVDPRFGRARFFLIVDIETDHLAACENSQSVNALQGAGIQAADTVARQGASALLTGHCGPKAFRALTAAGIEVYANVSGSVRDAVEKFKQGKYERAAGPDVQGHWNG